jgi:RHS repeat-associated protein
LGSPSHYGYAYDANGNLTAKGTVFTEAADGSLLFDKTNGEYWEYQYDLLNRMVAVRKNGALVASYVYDEKGYRVKKDSSAQGVSYYVFGLDGQVLYEEQLKKGAYYEYVYVAGKHFARVEGKLDGDGSERKKLFYALDHLGSTTMITDEAGKVVWQDELTPFGESSGQVGVLDENVKFTGKDLDSEINLFYFNARWYSAELGRFTSVDPLKDDVNWYVYVGGNPLNRVDPTGLIDQTTVQQGAEVSQEIMHHLKVGWEAGGKAVLAKAVFQVISRGGKILVIPLVCLTLQGSQVDRHVLLGGGIWITAKMLPKGWGVEYDHKYWGPLQVGTEEYIVNQNSGARFKASDLSIDQNGNLLGPALPAGYSYDQNGQIIAPDGNVMPSVEAAEAHAQGKSNWNVNTNNPAYKTVQDLVTSAGPLERLKGGVRQGFIEGDAQAILENLAKSYNAEIQRNKDELFFKSGDTRVGLHTSTRGGEATLHINEAGKLYKIRVQQGTENTDE